MRLAFGACLGCRFLRNSSNFVVSKDSAAGSNCSGPLIRAICGPPGVAAGKTDMCTCGPAFARRSLIVEPPGPMSPPTKSAGTCTSRGVPGVVLMGSPGGAAAPGGPGVPAGSAGGGACCKPGMPGAPAAPIMAMAGAPGAPVIPSMLGGAPGMAPGGPGNISIAPGMPAWGAPKASIPAGGAGTPSGQPFAKSASLIICSVFSMSPTIVTLPTVSFGAWSILISAPLRCRMS